MSESNRSARSKGAVMLASLGMTQESIASKSRVNRVQIARFQNGGGKPGPANRAIFERVFQIPPSSWDVPAEPAKPPRKALEAPGAPMARDEIIRRLQANLVAAIRQLDDPSSTPYEKTRTVDKAAEALTKLGKLTGETLSEWEVMNLPKFAPIAETIRRALLPWPEAEQALRKALEELGNE